MPFWFALAHFEILLPAHPLVVLLALWPGCFSGCFWRLTVLVLCTCAHLCSLSFSLCQFILKGRLPCCGPYSRPLLFSGTVHTLLLSDLPGLAQVTVTCLQPFACTLQSFPIELTLRTLSGRWKRLAKKVLLGLRAIVVLLRAAKKCSWKASCFLLWFLLVTALWPLGISLYSFEKISSIFACTLPFSNAWGKQGISCLKGSLKPMLECQFRHCCTCVCGGLC